MDVECGAVGVNVEIFVLKSYEKAPANDHKLEGLKRHTFILLQFWRPEAPDECYGLKSRCSREWFLLEGPGGGGENSFHAVRLGLHRSSLCLHTLPSLLW